MMIAYPSASVETMMYSYLFWTFIFSFAKNKVSAFWKVSPSIPCVVFMRRMPGIPSSIDPTRMTVASMLFATVTYLRPKWIPPKLPNPSSENQLGLNIGRELIMGCEIGNSSCYVSVCGVAKSSCVCGIFFVCYFYLLCCWCLPHFSTKLLIDFFVSFHTFHYFLEMLQILCL